MSRGRLLVDCSQPTKAKRQTENSPLNIHRNDTFLLIPFDLVAHKCNAQFT